ncbi:MAG: periplasmic heavy metal sensor [Acidobacteria bacterium]|nr:periplasmic heavy metal sensor [Acidobacteriota bacterium]
MRTSHKYSFTLRRLAAAVFGLALLCVSAVAQEPDAPQPAPQQQRPARAPNLMQRLNLSREQREQLREIRRQSEPEVRAQTRRVRLARRALDEAIYADAVDEALVEQRARELSAAQSALVRLRAATELKIRRILTAEQLQLFRTLRQQAQQQQLLQRRLNRNAPPQDGRQ